MDTQIKRVYRSETFNMTLPDGGEFQFWIGKCVADTPQDWAVDSIVRTNAPAGEQPDIGPGDEWDNLCEAFWDAHATLIEKEWIKPS